MFRYARKASTLGYEFQRRLLRLLRPLGPIRSCCSRCHLVVVLLGLVDVDHLMAHFLNDLLEVDWNEHKGIGIEIKMSHAYN